MSDGKYSEILVHLAEIGRDVKGLIWRVNKINGTIEKHDKELVEQAKVDVRIHERMKEYPTRFKTIETKLDAFKETSFKVKMIWVILGAVGVLALDLIKGYLIK